MIKVIVVDDSLLIREMLSSILSSDPEIQVVAVASDPYEARDLIKRHNPDVITLDIEMPKMSGLVFLEKIMRLRPMPVVMLSTLTQHGAENSIKAMEIGAVDCIGKPQRIGELEHMRATLCDTIRHAAKAQVRAKKIPTHSQGSVIPALPYHGHAAGKLIAIGASTGGVEALRDLLQPMPAHAPPIVVTQHMPELFTSSFAMRLNALCHIRVLESQDGMEVKPGHAYIAHGGCHMELKKKEGTWFIAHHSGPLVCGHRPSVDVLFQSIAHHACTNVYAAILTGMGKDGAAGLKKLRECGARTIAEDESSCVVFGMPRVAIELGAAEKILPLRKIAQELLKLAS